MTTNARRYKATINGKQYVIIGPGSDERMAAVTQIVNNELTQIKKLSPKISAEDAAILVAFNAVSDKLKMCEELSKEHSAAQSGNQVS